MDNVTRSIFNRLAMHTGAEAPWWWLSFVDGDRPTGSQFLGVAIVRGFDIGSASMEAHSKGCNPGGQVMGVEIPEDFALPDGFTDRLLTKEECAAFDRAVEARQS